MLKKTIDIFTTVVMVLLLILLGLMYGGKLFGVNAYSVLSGSMEPNYHTGSVVYVKTAKPESIKVGDVITFSLENRTTVTHRVVEIDSENRRFVTKGDANNTEDSPISFDSLYGKVVYTIPYLGYIAVFISAVYGKIILAAVFVALILLITVSEMLQKKSA